MEGREGERGGVMTSRFVSCKDVRIEYLFVVRDRVP